MPSADLYAKLDTRAGSVIVSALVGLGLAALFRKACKDKSCVVVQGPPPEETSKYVYKVRDKCYKYTPEEAACERH